MTTPGEHASLARPARLVALFFFTSIVLTSASAVADAVSAFTYLWQDNSVEAFSSIEDIMSGPDPRIRHTIDTVISPALALASALIMAACVVAFLVWQVRAHQNLRAASIEGLKWRPAVAAVAWFIPIANLVLPHAAVTELWRASDPERPADWRAAPRHWWIPVWWLALVASVSGKMLTARLYAGVFFPEELLLPAITNAATAIFHCVAAYLAILIVRRIGEMQDRGVAQSAF